MAARGQWIAVFGILGSLITALVIGVAFSSGMDLVTVGSRAPNFGAVDLASGDSTSLDRFEGEVVLLNIWATWCGPCEAEMPSMQRLYERAGHDGLKIVAVSVDGGDEEAVREWIAERGLTFEIWHDPTGRVERLYQTTGLPESFVIDREGTIVKKVIGATEWDHPTQLDLVRKLLGLDADTVARRDP